MSSGATDFDREMERELRRLLDPVMAARIPPPAVTRTGFMVKLLGGAGAAIVAKAVMGVAVLAVAAAGAGAVTEVAITGSLNPANWGQEVRQQVSDCRGKLATGQHSISDCASVLSSQHSPVVSEQHPAATSPALPSTDSIPKPVEAGNGQLPTAQASPAPAQVNVAPKLVAPSGNSPTAGCGPTSRDLQSGC